MVLDCLKELSSRITVVILNILIPASVLVICVIIQLTFYYNRLAFFKQKVKCFVLVRHILLISQHGFKNTSSNSY